MGKKVLLLNPPGQKVYLRDYYCSKTSQANYINHPIDLVILSGILGEKHEVSLLDAIVDRLSSEKCYRKIIEINPEVIIFLTGAVSWEEDKNFLRQLYSWKKEIK